MDYPSKLHEDIHDSYRLVANEFIRSRSFERTCPFPGNISQREESVGLLAAVCQTIENIAKRLSRRMRDRIDTFPLLIMDRFLCEMRVDQDYLLKELSTARADELSETVTNIFGPIKSMRVDQRDDARDKFLKLMLSFDRLLLCMCSQGEDCFEGLKASAESFLINYSVCRRRYMMTVS